MHGMHALTSRLRRPKRHSGRLRGAATVKVAAIASALLQCFTADLVASPIQTGRAAARAAIQPYTNRIPRNSTTHPHRHKNPGFCHPPKYASQKSWRLTDRVSANRKHRGHRLTCKLRPLVQRRRHSLVAAIAATPIAISSAAGTGNVP